MNSEREKGQHEIAIFKQFCACLPNTQVSHIKKCLPPKPDLSCTFNHQHVYFELARNYPKAFAQQYFSTKDHAKATWQEGDTRAMLKTKLDKNYQVNEPIYLLLYDDLGIALPNKVVVKKLKSMLTTREHIQFKQIWYFAQNQALEIYRA
ncbi:hypothetical protein [Colwellia sp. MEBiC06753]